MKSTYVLASCCHVASNLCFLLLKFLVLKASGFGGSLSSGSPVSPSTETVEETRKLGRMMRWLFQRWNNDFMKARHAHDHSLGVTCASWNFVTLSFRFTSEVHLACLIRWYQMSIYPSIYPSIHQSISDGSAPAALGNLLLDPPDPQIIRTTQRLYSDFPNISRTCMFLFSDSFSFSLLFFSLLLLSSLWLFPSLRFIISPYCRKFDF